MTNTQTNVWTVIRKYVGYETIERYFNVPHENKAVNLPSGNILQRWRQSRGNFWSKELEIILCWKTISIRYTTQFFRNDCKQTIRSTEKDESGHDKYLSKYKETQNFIFLSAFFKWLTWFKKLLSFIVKFKVK